MSDSLCVTVLTIQQPTGPCCGRGTLQGSSGLWREAGRKKKKTKTKKQKPSGQPALDECLSGEDALTPERVLRIGPRSPYHWVLLALAPHSQMYLINSQNLPVQGIVCPVRGGLHLKPQEERGPHNCFPGRVSPTCLSCHPQPG